MSKIRVRVERTVTYEVLVDESAVQNIDDVEEVSKAACRSLWAAHALGSLRFFTVASGGFEVVGMKK
ncbi:hypothetical protein [Burkholderia pseudomallei]|uniref:hypothetical protein n=1 Tax=Burkholderia pseudomallei TaxID=28450 RepID=UPI000A1A1FF0|nr:hypothetical protein [Burkholderia pseudomallei]ARK42617.1 hypothetical protein BOC60_20255 [Burkholderia pseudomallei]